MLDLTLGTIAINNTADTSDNITLFNPSNTGEGATQTIPVKITNTSSTQQTFQLSVNSTNNGTPYATLSQSSVTLPAGASTGTSGIPEVTLTPKADSTAPNDVHIIATDRGQQVAEDSMTIVSVTFGPAKGVNSPDIRNADTPATMTQDRIPPRANTPFYVNVTPNLLGSGESVSVAVTGQNASNGIVTINGKSTPLVLSSSGPLNLSSPNGTTQTMPGHAGNLRFAVIVDGISAAQSKPFSVSAIPIQFHQIVAKVVTDPSFILPIFDTLEFNYAWNSDSGQLKDLDQVWVGEYVTYPNNGIIAGPGKPWPGNLINPTVTPNRNPTAGYLWGDNGTLPMDDHHYPLGGLPMPGPADSFTATQYYGFHDFRSDNSPVAYTANWQINLAGPIYITRSVLKKVVNGKTFWFYQITKSGLTATVLLT